MFFIELIGRLAGPEVLAALAALFTALGPAIMALAKRRETQDTLETSALPESRTDAPGSHSVEELELVTREQSGEATESPNSTRVHYYHAEAAALSGELRLPVPRAATKSESTEELTTAASQNRGAKMLVCYAILLAIFGLITAIHYWNAIKQREDLAFTMIGLLLTMVAGMFVQVITSNYRASTPLFHVTASQLAYPLLFSPIVFYPVWALTTGGSQHLFAFYAAFLDGYFWESVVSSAKPVAVEAPAGRSGRRRRKAPVAAQPA